MNSFKKPLRRRKVFAVNYNNKTLDLCDDMISRRYVNEERLARLRTIREELAEHIVKRRIMQLAFAWWWSQ